MSEFTYGNITQRNRNPLIRMNYDGAIGGKTGHTNEGGYGVVGVVKRDYRRLVGVVNKAKTPRQRSEIITALFDYGFQNYKKLTLFEKDKPVAELATWLGKRSKISVAPNQPIAINIPRDKMLDDVKVSVKYKGPIYAPIGKGAKLASLVIEVKNYKTFEYSLFSKEKIDKVSGLRKINWVLRHKIKTVTNRLLPKPSFSHDWAVGSMLEARRMSLYASLLRFDPPSNRG